MDEVTSGSPQAMDYSSIMENYKKIQLSDYYPSENVRLMVHDIQGSFNLLKSGQSLPITASSIVATTKLLLCQVEECRAVFYAISVKIDTEQERGLMGKDNAALVKIQATPSGVKKALLDMALTQYKCLKDNGRWPPSQTDPKKQSDSLPDVFQATVFPSAFQALADELKALCKDFGTKPSGTSWDLLMNGLLTSKAILLHHGVSSPQVIFCVTEEVNQYLTEETQKEYLHWHFHLGHLNSNIIQWLLCQPSFGNSHKVHAAAHCTPPKCTACEYGKAHRCPLESTLSIFSSEREPRELQNLMIYSQVQVSQWIILNRRSQVVYAPHEVNHNLPQLTKAVVFLLTMHLEYFKSITKSVLLQKRPFIRKCISKIGHTIKVP
jgi:hypothetical protein